MKYILFIFLIFGLKTFSYININPVTFDKRVDNMGEGQEFRLYNPMDYPMRYSIYLSDEGIESSMKDWIDIYPKILTIKPKRTGQFKIYIKSPKGAPKGEYMATIGIKELLLSNFDNSKNSGVQILTHLKIDIAGYVGNLIPKVFLKDFKVNLNNKRLTFSGYIANVGKRRGDLDFYLAKKNIEDSLYLGKLRLLKKEKTSAEELNQDLNSFDKEFIKNFEKYNTLIIKDSFSGEIIYKKKI